MQTQKPSLLISEREMEYYSREEGLMEELVGLREMEMEMEMEYYINHDFSTNNNGCWNVVDEFSVFNKSGIVPTNSDFSLPNTNNPMDQTLGLPVFYSAAFGDDLSSPPGFSSDSSNTNIDPQTLPYYYNSFFAPPIFDLDVESGPPCKPEPVSDASFNMTNTKTKLKKLNGQPSKNLMAERRRRKRLNDRLSMLRSVVPKISKMDRTSILGDTIDYMKELLDSINKLQVEMNLGGSELGLVSIFKNAKPEETFIRNSPKFEVERRNLDTRIEICCGGKPGLLLSTVTALEALGLDIEQCVISCFNDFAMQASCSQDLKQMAVLDSEDIKQALFRNAGYGGRCL